MGRNLTRQQRRAVEAIEVNVLVSAGAGSGKTYVLVERFIEILRNSPKLSVSNLVAVTYTRRAANEMLSRLKSRLEDLVAESADEAERSRWLNCLMQVDDARIGTIHSLCESILKAFPAEASVDPGFEVLDELDRVELLEESINQALTEVIREQLEEQELILNYSIETVRTWVASLVKNSLEFQAALSTLPALSQEALSEHCRNWLGKLNAKATQTIVKHPEWGNWLRCLELSCLDSKNKLGQVRTQVLNLAHIIEKKVGLPEELECMHHLKELASVINLRIGGKDDASKTVKNVLKQMRELIEQNTKDLPYDIGDTEALNFAHLRELVNLAKRACSYFRDGKTSCQKLDFNDLIELTYKLLTSGASYVRQHYNNTIAAILVDEFQDTNKIQAELISLLAGVDTRLFLIGDDKQSIYRFQGADVSTFNEWKEFFSLPQTDLKHPALKGGVSVESLSTSFRSHPEIVSFVNVVSESLFDGQSIGQTYGAQHQTLEASRSDDLPCGRVDLVIVDGAGEDGSANREEARYSEGLAVAAWICEKITDEQPIVEKTGLQRPINWGDFAVLVQRNEDFKPVERAFAKAGVPYVALGGTTFLVCQEVYDIENLLKFLWCPQDSQALLGVLRSPMFAVTDDVVHGLKQGTSQSLWELVKVSSSTTLSMLGRANEILSRLYDIAWTRPLGELLRKCINYTNYDIVLMGMPNGRQRCRNLWKLVALAYENNHMSVGEFVQCLTLMRDLKVKQTAAPVDGGNSVKLMTIHAAKGLEFPAVALAALDTDAGRLRSKLMFHREYGIALDTTRDTKAVKPAFFQVARFLEKDMAIAEKKRLLYVAMTRARDYLGFFIERGGYDVPSFKQWLTSAINLVVDSVDLGGKKRLEYSRGACFTLKVTDQKQETVLVDITNLKDPTLKDGVSLGQYEHAKLECNLNLISPCVGPGSVPQSVNWQRRLRVTPSSAGGDLRPVVAGVFFHKLMERLPGSLEMPSESILEDACHADGIRAVHPALKQSLVLEGRKLLDRFFESELYGLMRSAARRLHEMPYLVSANETTALIKRPDLLLEDAYGTWHVIDYKTDHFDLSEIHEHAKEHKKQLEEYAHDIKMLTGVICRTAIYFAQHGILYYLNENC